MNRTSLLAAGALLLVSPTQASAAKPPSNAEAARQFERWLIKTEDIDTEDEGFASATCKRGETRRGVTTYKCKALFGHGNNTTKEGMGWADYAPKKKKGKRWDIGLYGSQLV